MSLIVLFLFWLYDYLISWPSKILSSSLLTLFSILSSFIFFSLIVIFSDHTIVFSSQLIFPVLAAINGYLGFIFFTKSLKNWNPWVSSALANTYPAFTIIIGYLFLKEYISVVQLLFLFIILMWIILSSFNLSDIKNFKNNKWKNTIFFALCAAILWSVEVTFIDRSIHYYHPIISTWLIELSALILIFPLILVKRQKIFKEFIIVRKSILVYVCFIGLVWAIGNLAFSYAFSLWSLAIVSAIAACSPAVTAILSRIFWEEKLEYSQYIAIWILVFWISGLSYFSI